MSSKGPLATRQNSLYKDGDIGKGRGHCPKYVVEKIGRVVCPKCLKPGTMYVKTPDLNYPNLKYLYVAHSVKKTGSKGSYWTSKYCYVGSFEKVIVQKRKKKDIVQKTGRVVEPGVGEEQLIVQKAGETANTLYKNFELPKKVRKEIKSKVGTISFKCECGEIVEYFDLIPTGGKCPRCGVKLIQI